MPIEEAASFFEAVQPPLSLTAAAVRATRGPAGSGTRRQPLWINDFVLWSVASGRYWWLDSDTPEYKVERI